MLGLAIAAVLAAAPPAPGGPPLLERAKAVFRPLSKTFDSKENPVTPEKVALGKALFFDTRLSKDGTISCNSCHDVSKGGADTEPFSTGVGGQKGGRNAPTVFNAGVHFAQFWDGRAATLEEQAKGPVLNPKEMAMSGPLAVAKVLRSIPGYPAMFQKAFPQEKEPVTFENFARAVGAYERTLATPSRFDAWLSGDAKALTAQETAGLALFLDSGCAGCHQGEGVGGSMFQKFGLVQPVPLLKDPGRYEVTKQEADRFFFKVPSLRNVEKTAPYFHDARAQTLTEAIRLMGTHQLGRTLEDAEVQSIVAFLKSLSGAPPKGATTPPALPPSGAVPRATPDTTAARP